MLVTAEQRTTWRRTMASTVRSSSTGSAALGWLYMSLGSMAPPWCCTASAQCGVSVPPTLRAGSIKMQQDWSPAEHLLQWYPCSVESLSSLALPALPLTGGTYGQKKQEEQAHARDHAHYPPACRRHRCGR